MEPVQAVCSAHPQGPGPVFQDASTPAIRITSIGGEPAPSDPNATIETTLSGGVPVRGLVRNRAGDTLRTLFDGFRPAGVHTDTWDGTDDGGFPLGHGPYFVVVEYEVGGETRTLDLTNTTGGVRYNPPRGRFPSIFRPLEDDLLDVNFTIPAAQGASEVTAFIGLFNTDTRFVTLLERVPFGVGSHTIFWDGTAPSGGIAVAPPGDRFLYGAFGFTLSDNAIMLESAPDISGVSVDPNFFDPATPGFLTPDDPVAVVTYTLDKPADPELGRQGGQRPVRRQGRLPPDAARGGRERQLIDQPLRSREGLLLMRRIETTIPKPMLIALVATLLFAVPSLAVELTVADYVDLTIARLELAQRTWSEAGRSPTQAEEDDLYESMGTTVESYFAFAAKHRREIEAYLEAHADQRETIESLSDAIRQWIEQAEVE